MKNINLFLLFFKLNMLSTFLSLNSNNLFNFFFIFNKFFFSFLLLRLIKKSNQKFLSIYTNNFQLSLLFYNFKTISWYFVNNSFSFKDIMTLNEKYFLNLYFLSIKIIKVTLNKKFYKNLFFYFLLIWSPIWYQHNLFFSFYLNFIFTSYTLHLFKFYNGPFFKVYNF
jgi:hypothetical protein